MNFYQTKFLAPIPFSLPLIPFHSTSKLGLGAVNYYLRLNCELQIVDATRTKQLFTLFSQSQFLFTPIVFFYSSNLHIIALYFLILLFNPMLVSILLITIQPSKKNKQKYQFTKESNQRITMNVKFSQQFMLRNT